MLRELLRSALLGGLLLCAAPLLAQDYGYSVLVDVDQQPGTGCTVDLGGGNLVPGVERRLSAWSSSGVFQIASLTLEVCQGGTFGPATGVGGPYPIGLNNGVAGGDVVELGASIEQLTGASYPPRFRAYFAAESAAGSDLLGSNASGGAIVVGAPAAPVPGLGWLGLAILMVSCVLILRSRRLRPLLRNGSLAVLVLGSGLVIAANWVLDGQVSDWGTAQPVATDPAGDSTSGQSAIDITAGFVAFENGNAFFRIDLRDVQNNAPVATPVAVSGLEDAPLLIALAGSDSESPTVTFTIASAPTSGTLGPVTATSATTAEVTYTPAADINGTDSFTFTVSDGELDSAPATVTVNIQPVNDAPSFTAQDASILEDAGTQTATVATDVLAGPPDEAGQVLSFDITGNDNPGLFVGAATISPAGVLSATPAPGQTGTANLTVVLRDDGGTADGGVDVSAAQTIVITVEDVNDPPTFTPGAPPTVLEDAGAQTLVNWATAIDDGKGSGQALTFIVQDNSNPGLFSAGPAITPDGTLSFTPADDANGSADITIVLTDDGGTGNGGNNTSAPHTFAITVTPVNDAPDFTAVDPPAVFQDSGAAEVPGWATFSAGPVNESSQVALEYQVSAISNAALFSAAPTVDADGTLRYTPAAGVRGTSQFTVRVRDNGGTADGGVDLSAAQTFTITVEAVNNAPSFTPGADVSVLEDAGAQAVPAWATNIDDNDGGTQTLTFVVQNNSNPGLFTIAPAVDPATGTLSYTTADDANGSAQVTLVLRDDGGTANGGNDTSAPHTLTITVTAVNDAPSFTLQDPPASLEDAGLQSATVATAISAGPSDESAQSVSFVVTPVSSDPTLTFASAPTINASGVVDYVADANAWGSATFNVVAQDNGGTANGGNDTSAAQTLTITITPVNDAPSFTAANPAPSAEDAGAQTVAGWVSAFDPGANETGQTVAEYVVSDVVNSGLFSAGPAVSADGTLSYTAAADASGSSQFTVRVRDSGGTADGGIDLSAPQTFTITVTGVNDPPVVDLNGPAAGTGFSASFIEAGAPVAIVDAAAMTVTDIEMSPLVSATVAITNVLDGADEVLAVDATGSGLSVGFTGGVLTLTGTAAPSVYQTVLRTTTYANGSNNPDQTPRLIEFTAQDDQGDVSLPAVAIVTVAGVNSAPVFTPGANPTVLEDAGAQTIANWATAIHDGDDGTQALTFVIQSNSNPALFTSGPAITTDGTLSYTPAADANGSAAITVVLQDDGGTDNGGSDTSAPVTFDITVTAVNDAPSFTVPANAPATLENAGAQSVSGFAQNIQAGPVDEAGQALTFSTVVSGTTGTLAFSSAPVIDPATGTLTYTAQADTSGTATVTVTLGDDGGTANGGVDTSAAQSFTITVDGVNSAPVFTPGPSVTVHEDEAPYDQSWATGIDDGDLDEVQALTFVVQSNSNPSLFSAGPAVDATTGNLSFELAADAFGTATISLVLRDDGGTANGGVDTSTAVSFDIDVLAVNDAPTFDVPAAAPTVMEDAGPQTVPGFASNISPGPANESSQTLTGFTLVFESIDSTLSFSAGPAIDVATGTLTYTPAPNAFGNATVAATLHDDGGVANGGFDQYTLEFNISVTGINDAPTFTAGGPVTVLEDAGAQNLPWASGMNDGDGGTQVLNFVITGNTNPGLFTAGPSLNTATGNLSFTPAANAFGTADITVVLMDNGGTANGGVNSSTPVTFTITVQAVNDPPVVVAPASVAVHRHIGINVPAAHAHNLLANVSDVDGPDAQPFTLTAVTNAATVQGGRVSTFADGSWTYHPPASNTQASDSFTYEVCDSGVPMPAACSTATVTLVLSGTAIWFVDTAAAAGGVGTLDRPLQTLSAAVSAAGANGTIFLHSGNYVGGATLQNGQVLVGQGATGASFDSLMGITPPSLSIARPTLGGSRPLITTSGGTVHGITLGSGNTVRGIEIGNTSGIGLNGSNVGTLSLGENRISGTGQAMSLANGTFVQVGPGAAFDQVSSTSGTSNVALSGMGGTADFGTGALAGASGTAVLISGGTATLTYAGSITKTAAGRLIDIDGAGSGTVTLSGALSCTGSCGTGAGHAAIRVAGRTGGTYTFSGTSKTLTVAGGNPGVSITDNAGSTVRFANGGLAIATTGTAFNAVNGATVAVLTGAQPNTLTASAGAALNIVNTTIGAEDMTFRSISSSGAASGIVLDVTGSVGALVVTGNGGTCTSAATCTGGAIQNTTAHGILLRNTTEPSFTRMYVGSTAHDGINGTEVNGFSFTDGVVTGNGGPGNLRSNIAFNTTAVGTERNLYGVVTITGNTLSNASNNGVQIYNFNGTISRADITGNTLTSPVSPANSSGWGIGLIAYGSASTVANVTTANITNNVIRNFPGGGGIQVQGGNGNAAGPAGVLGQSGSATNIINITGNRVSGQSVAVPMNAQAITTSVAGRGQGNFNISDNGTVGEPLGNNRGIGIASSAFGQAVVTSRIHNNVIVSNNAFGAQGIGGGLGLTYSTADAPQMTIDVQNNRISQTDGNGILLVARDTNGTLNARVLNNIVAAPLSGFREGIRIDSGNAPNGDNDTVCLHIAGNTSAGVGVPQGIGLRKQGTNPAEFAFRIHGMAATASPGVENYVNSLNPAANGTILISATSGFGSCNLP